MRGKDNRAKQPVSRVRKTYFIRLFGRIIVLFSVVAIYFFKSEWLDILHGNNFFKKLSPLHILWIIWVIDMISQLIPVRKHLPLGSGKHFKENFKPIMDKINYKALREYIISPCSFFYICQVYYIRTQNCLAIEVFLYKK